MTLARDERPNLILMDIQLPGMDGLEATALLKRDDATRAIPVIALTALAMKGRRGAHSSRGLRWLHREADSLQAIPGDHRRSAGRQHEPGTRHR